MAFSKLILNTPRKHTVERVESPPRRFSLLDDMTVERGTKSDWDALHHLHYKAESLPPAPVFYRCMRRNELVGVVVLSLCSLLSAPRHVMLPNLKPGQDTTLTNKHRPKWLNANMRRAARIITSTMYRGTGVSYRMVNLACRMEGVRYVEIQSSMSKFNPFDQKAGFKRAPLKRAAAYDLGVKFFRQNFSAIPSDHQAILEEFESRPKGYQKVLLEQLREFYYRHSAREKTGQNLNAGMDKVNQMSASALIREIQQLVFASIVYGLYENPDFGRTDLPSKLPLLAYDNQSVNEPLNLELL